jgi:hypothetical protein
MRSAVAVVLVILVLPALSGFAASETPVLSLEPLLQASDSARILLIGNSHIFMNDLPTMLSQLAESAGIDCTCGQAAYGGFELAQHAADSRTLSRIEEEPWDVVVLQERTTILLTRLVDRAEPAALALNEVAASAGARVLLLMMWAPFSGTVEDGRVDASQSEIARTTVEIAGKIGALVAPVGLAWEAVEDAYPEINLWRSDQAHASEAGTYLMACVLFATLWGQSPLGLTYVAGLSQSDALALQETAAEVVSAFNIENPADSDESP